MSSVNETSSVGNTRNTSTATKDLEEEVQNLLKKNSQLSADLAKCLKTITRLRRQRSALLDVITLKRQESHDSNDDDDDDDSSVYDEDRDLGDLSEPTEESSSEEEDDNDVEFKPPSRIRTVLNRTSTLSSKRGKARHRLVHLPKDTNGNYVMPVKLGNMILISLGEIDPSPQYYNSRYIFPVGYTCKRPYKSIKDPNTQVMYTSYIKRGTAGPKFCLFAEDDPDNVVESDTPTGAWTTVMREVHQNSNRTYINCSGPEYFGLSNPNVILMIQELPNADKCEGYIWRDIEKEDGYGVVVDAPLRKRIKTEPGTEPSSPNSPTYARRSMTESNLPDASSPDDTGSMISTEDTERPSTKRRRR